MTPARNVQSHIVPDPRFPRVKDSNQPDITSIHDWPTYRQLREKNDNEGVCDF